MSLPRVALIMLVVGTVTTGSYFFITNPLKIGEKGIATVVSELISKPLVKTNILTTKSPLDINLPIDTNTSPNENSAEQDPNNLTNQITKHLSEFLVGKITSSNTEGPALQDDGTTKLTVPSEQQITDFVSQNIGSITPPSVSANTEAATYHPKVSETKLNISQNQSQAAQVKYVKDVLNTIKRYSTAITKADEEILGAIQNDSDPSLALQLAKTYGEAANALAQISIPANWTTLHRQILSYYFTAESIWQDIANYQNDPLQSVAAVQTLDILHNAAKGIPQLIFEVMTKNGITFSMVL